MLTNYLVLWNNLTSWTNNLNKCKMNLTTIVLMTNKEILLTVSVRCPRYQLWSHHRCWHLRYAQSVPPTWRLSVNPLPSTNCCRISDANSRTQNQRQTRLSPYLVIWLITICTNNPTTTQHAPPLSTSSPPIPKLPPPPSSAMQTHILAPPKTLFLKEPHSTSSWNG